MLSDVAASQVGIPALNGGLFLESFRLFTPVSEIPRGYVYVVVVLLGNGFPDRDNPIEIWERKRPEQHRVHRAERGCVRTDAQRQGDHSHNGEARALLKSPHAETHVVEQSSHYSLLLASQRRLGSTHPNDCPLSTCVKNRLWYKGTFSG